MHVFITGGSGRIGSAVVPELLAHGHSVVALARSESSAAALEAAGAQTVRGGLTDLDVIRDAVGRAEGVIHLAFGNDFSSAEALAGNIADETAAVKTIAAELVGSDRPFVVVSGTPRAEGRPSTEEDPLPSEGPVAGRAVTLTEVLGMASEGLRVSAVRLPRTVHSDGDGGFAGLLTQIARQSGVSGFIGDGSQRWPAVHAADAAVLFRLALEQAPAGTSWHAVADEGDAVRDIAEVIGRRLGVPVQSVPPETYGPLGPVFGADQPASSALTRARLGWEPTHPSLLDDLESIQP